MRAVYTKPQVTQALGGRRWVPALLPAQHTAVLSRAAPKAAPALGAFSSVRNTQWHGTAAPADGAASSPQAPDFCPHMLHSDFASALSHGCPALSSAWAAGAEGSSISWAQRCVSQWECEAGNVMLGSRLGTADVGCCSLPCGVALSEMCFVETHCFRQCGEMWAMASSLDSIYQKKIKWRNSSKALSYIYPSPISSRTATSL